MVSFSLSTLTLACRFIPFVILERQKLVSSFFHPERKLSNLSLKTSNGLKVRSGNWRAGTRKHLYKFEGWSIAPVKNYSLPIAK
jgi:hypothetical protein